MAVWDNWIGGLHYLVGKERSTIFNGLIALIVPMPMIRFMSATSE